MRAGHQQTRRRSPWLPESRAGRWALGLFVVAGVAVLWIAAIAAERHAATTFDHDPLLAGLAVAAALCGVASAALGGYAIVRHERALLVLLSTAAGLNVLAYVFGEAIRRP